MEKLIAAIKAQVNAILADIDKVDNKAAKAGTCPQGHPPPREGCKGISQGQREVINSLYAIKSRPGKGRLFHFYFTIPLNPMKARARMPTLTMAIGTPLKAFGTSFRERCSRMPANITMARP